MRMLTSIVLALACSASAAEAADYIFTVPVRVENMRFAERATLSCNVQGRYGPIANSPDVPVPLTAGAYHGTMTISIDLMPGYLRSDAWNWQCRLSYYWHRPAGTSSIPAGDVAIFYQRETGQAVASQVLDGRGSLLP